MDVQIYIQLVTAVATSMGVLIALVAVLRTERQITRSLRAQAYLKLADEWRDETLHRHVLRVLDLWEEWRKKALKEGKASDATEWLKFTENRAKDWAKNRGDGFLYNRERRAVSQFLSKLGPLITNKYLKSEDVFGVVPEMGRLLAVLYPIEIAIQNKEREKAAAGIADWDSPFPKWEFKELWREYFDWFNKGGKECLKLPCINRADPQLGHTLWQKGNWRTRSLTV